MIIEDEALRSLYHTTALERLQKLQAELLALEEEPADGAALNTMRQELHSLKGDSKCVGLAAMVELTHRAETLVKALQAGELSFTLEVGDCLYQSLATAERLIQAAASGEGGEDASQQAIARLEALLNGESPTSPPPAPDAPPSLYIDDVELREIYRTTSQDRLQALATKLEQLAQTPNDEQVLAVMRREIHSLKGDSRAVGLEPIGAVAEMIETLIKDIGSQSMPLTPEVNGSILEGLAAAGQMVQEATSGEPSGVDINQVSDRLLTAAATAIAAPQPPLLEGPFSPAGLAPVATGPLVAEPPVIAPSPSVLPPDELDLAGPALAAAVAEPLVLEPAFVEPMQPIALADEDAELLEIYRATSKERLQRFEADLLHLEKAPSDAATLARLMREAHSLKGDARTAGADLVEELAHAMEDVLTGVQRQALTLDAAVSDRLYESLDAIEHLVQVEPDTADPRIHQLVEALINLAPDVVEPAPAATLSGAPAEPAAADGGSSGETIRIHSRELDALMAQADTLAVTRIQIAQTATQTRQLVALWDEWQANRHKPQSDLAALSYEERLAKLMLTLRATVQDNSGKLDQVAEELRERIRKLQLLPLSKLFQPLPRLVRDLGNRQHKAIDLVIEGETTLADKRLLEGIRDALMHLVRNAIDHGIEPPEERKAAGKPTTATLKVAAHQTAVSLTIEIKDDGRGLDLEQIRQTAVKRGLYSQAALEEMSTSQIQRLILAPGFSTRSFITEVSGRGVGLDVVQTQVEQLKGNLQIDSTPGQGTTFRLQLSTALSTANVVLVKVQGLSYAIPIEFLQMTLLVTPEQITSVDGRDTISVDGQAVPVVNLLDSLALTRSPSYREPKRSPQYISGYRPCALLKVGNERTGFFVDQLVDQMEVVSKPLSPLLKRVPNVSGATILGTGEICMILSPPDLLKALQAPGEGNAAPTAPAAQRKPVILLVEDSPPVRIQEKRLLEGAGYEVVTATNGLEGYNTFNAQDFDAVVSDVEMPYLDGFSLTAQIRQNPRGDLPIILVTTLDSDADRQRGADAGANAHILKGRFNQDVLLETLERLI